MRWLVVAGAIAVAAGCAEDEPRPTTPASGRGITAQLPEGWAATRTNLTPQLGDPRQAFAAATYPLRYRRTECAHVPGSALEDLGPRDAFVELEERGKGGGGIFPPRPERFGPSLGTTSESSDCVPRASFREHWFEFQDAGRYFHGRVAFGPEVTAQTQDEAWSILESLRVDPTVEPGWTASG